MGDIDLDRVFVADLESKGFLEDIKGEKTDLHVLGVGYKNISDNWEIKTTNKENDVKKVFENPNNTIVGHNFYMFDIPSLEKIFKDINIQATIIDSLLVAWYIEPNRLKEGGKYGLADFGEEFGVKKPEVNSEEWAGLEESKIEIIKYYESINI